MRSTLLLLFLACACSHSDPTPSTQSNTTAVTSVDLKANKGGGTITFETGRMRGILTIAPGMEAGYELTTQTGAGETTMKTKIQIDGRELSIESDSIRVGTNWIGPFSGEVKVEVKQDGIFVDGAKKSDF